MRYEKPPLEEVADELVHYGTKRHSGRYPWGSGDEPYQHSGDFISRIRELEKSGLSQKEIADHFGLTIDNYRKERRAANNDRKALELERVLNLKEKGYSSYKISEITGMPERTVSEKIKADEHGLAKLREATNTANFLKERMQTAKYLDVGIGVEKDLRISRGKMDEALYLLEMEGYKVHKRHIDQLGMPGQKTTVLTLCKPGTEIKDLINADVKEIESVKEYVSDNDGQTFHKRFVYPKSMDSSRLQIRYREDGGIERDGVIELRRNVPDLDLGDSRCSQVRILVDGTHYLKGMAVYADDMPDGVDVIFNTNKSKDVPMQKVLKEIKSDPDNPFGASIKDIEKGGQYYYIDKDGKEQLGLINKRSDEGDWSDWSNALPSQFLSKQKLDLAKRQINLSIDAKQEELDTIMSLNNPTVKKKLLMEYADGCDSDSVKLKAASLPRQQYHVILPINSLKDTEIYAPNYEDGEKVALIRYPHAGTFEIPILTVNNKHPEGRKLLGSDVADAVGINYKVAERLSGADFDGDTVMVIPTNDKVKINSTPALRGLADFDAKMKYGTVEKIVDGEKKYYNNQGQEVKIMKDTQNQMGRISNLITDMTIRGATDTELAAATRHSMVVIDAEKHKLDFKKSEIDNNIKYLREKYQASVDPETGKVSYGASTIISRAKNEQSVLKRQGERKINMKGEDWYDPSKPEGSLIYKQADDVYYPEMAKPGKKDNPNYRGYRLADGKKVLFDPTDKEQLDYYRPVKKVDKETGEITYTNKTGELTYRVGKRTQASTQMAETDDARTLISPTKAPMELLYADYANKLKSLANEARKEYMVTGEIRKSATATNTYKDEVASLLGKLYEAQQNTTRERRAQLLANSERDAKVRANPDLKKHSGELKKIEQQALERARATTGAKRKRIEITDREWDAIQAGAISKTKLWDILNYADMDIVKEKCMPRQTQSLTTAQISSLKAMMKTGRYTAQQAADRFNISVSQVRKHLNGKE